MLSDAFAHVHRPPSRVWHPHTSWSTMVSSLSSPLDPSGSDRIYRMGVCEDVWISLDLWARWVPVGLDSSRAPSAADCDTRLRHGAEEERQRERRTDAHEDCHRVCRQMQAQKVQARMQKELSRGQNRCASARHQHETTCSSTKHVAPSITNQGDACVREAFGIMERLP